MLTTWLNISLITRHILYSTRSWFLNFLFFNSIVLQYLAVWELSTEKPSPVPGWKISLYIGPDEVKLWTNWSIRGTQHLINAQRGTVCVPTLHARNNILTFWKLQKDLAPAALRICSYESQNVRDQGAILNQHGRNPLYKAETDKFRQHFLRIFLYRKTLLLWRW